MFCEQRNFSLVCVLGRGNPTLIYDVVLFSGAYLEFRLLMFRCSDQILNSLIRSDFLQYTDHILEDIYHLKSNVVIREFT